MFRKMQFAAMCLPVILAAYLCSSTPVVSAIASSEVIAVDDLVALVQAQQEQVANPTSFGEVPQS